MLLALADQSSFSTTGHFIFIRLSFLPEFRCQHNAIISSWNQSSLPSFYTPLIPLRSRSTNFSCINFKMAEVKQAPIITQQPAPQAQPVDSPAYKQVTSVTGSEDWTNDIFDCFKGDDNLCMFPTERPWWKGTPPNTPSPVVILMELTVLFS
jgi:hypothetical protein